MRNSHLLPAFVFCIATALFADDASLTLVKMTDEVLVSDAHRLGMNLESDAWYGSAQLTKLRDYRNFDGVNYRSIFWGPSQPADGLFSWTGLPKNPPLNQWKEILTGAKFTVISGPAYGETGVVQGFTNRLYSGRDLTFVEFDQPITKGLGSQNAIMIERSSVSNGFIDTLKGDYWISGKNTLADDGKGGAALLMGSGGSSSLRLKGMRVEFADCDGEWSLKLRAKAVDGSPSLSASLTTGSSDKETIQPAGEWTDYEMKWTASGASGEYLQCVLNVSGGSVLVDDIRFSKEGDSNPTAFRDDLVKTLKELNPGVLRRLQMGGSTIKNCIVNPEDSFAYASSIWTEPGSAGKPIKYDYSLHQFYELCEEIGTTPWFCLPGTLTPDEVTFFMEYLGGSDKTAGGKLRIELGHPVPWTETFDRIHVEFGNEAWNSWGPFACSGFNGPDYWKKLIEAGKESPFYSTNVLFYVAGQNFQGGLNKNIARFTPNADRFAIAPYMIHEFRKEDEERLNTDEKLFQWLFAYPQVELLRNPGMKDNGTIAKGGMDLAIYEVNHHAASGKGSAETRNRFLTSIAGGLNILNTMLLSLENYGVRDMCFFTLFGEQNTAYEVKDVRLFGALLSMKSGEELARPHWQALCMANQVMAGDLVRTEMSGCLPTYSAEIYQKQSKALQLEEGLQTFFSYAFADEKNRGLILLNLDISGERQVKLDLNHPVEGAPQSWLLSAPTADSNNEREHKPQVSVTEGTVTELTNGSVVTMPPCSMLALKWNVK